MKRWTFIAAAAWLALGLASAAFAGNLRVLRVGLGAGTVSSDLAGISCGTDCDHSYTTSSTVTLTAAAAGDSTFVGWQGDCTGTTSCALAMNADHSVKAMFATQAAIPPLTDLTPAGIAAYLANPTAAHVNSPARFIAALPAEFRKNWIMMSRSESLQTGTANAPRFLLPNANAQSVFTFGLMRHSSYPGADPNAIEYMEWRPSDKNFHFHEIVLGHIDPLGAFPARERSVSADDPRCTKCHSTRNVPNPGPHPGTTGIPIGAVKSQNKPNWDTYDSWGGMLPFNRDRIYRGSVEDAAFRRIFDLWNWRNDDLSRSFIEQLDLQPNGAASAHPISRVASGPDEGAVVLSYDAIAPPGSTTTLPGVTYSFDAVAGTPPGSDVQQRGDFLTLHHSAIPGSDEGRGVRFFDVLGGLVPGAVNQIRIADEVASQRSATGNVPFDARPLALAISKQCLRRDAAANTIVGTSPLTLNLAFFAARNGGMTINQVYADTRARTESVPRRKADIQKLNLSRIGDVYIRDAADERGLIQEYGALSALGTSTSFERLRSEVFRRPTAGFRPDATVMGGIYVDREDYSPNTDFMALYRYLLEPLGVSVDKWSMGVRGRSRTYSFADVFGTYVSELQSGIEANLAAEPIPGLAAVDCAALISYINTQSAALPAATAVPTFSDVQRILNKGCIECHGGLAYPPFDKFFPADYLDLSEDETNSTGTRLGRSHGYMLGFTSSNPDPTMSYLYQRISAAGEGCPFGMMPCGGPPLSKVDVETIARWIAGSRPFTYGDPHIKTVDGTHYDFQSAGEFTLLRGEGLEIQTRQTPVSTEGPLGENPHTGLSSCVSINTAAAMKVGPHRITYQPMTFGERKTSRMLLRVDGEAVELTAGAIALGSGGRILATTAGGIQIEYQGGTDVVITPGFWEPYQAWYLNIDVRRARATDGIMGAIAPQNWLPMLPDGTFLGPRPATLSQRYQDLYRRFADAWRVTDATSLFDYAPGTSTRTHTLAAWPGEAPRSCTVPPTAGFPDRPPVKAMPLDQAKAHCRAVVADALRANCEQDVMITGDAGFAKTYVAAEKIQLNEPPKAPVLTFPDADKTDLTQPIDFGWTRTTDADGGSLNYHLCVWAAGEPRSFGKCRELPKRNPLLEGQNLWLLVVALIVLLLIVLIAAIKNKGRRNKLLLLALLIVMAIVLVLHHGRQTNMSSAVAGLESGKAYFWKVIVEDGQGGTNESELRRFHVR
jgi:hypothetical protein